jgi:hypothetical protein
MVDRRTCFVGEPVVATFKLFSRLQSKSEIIKNPGFYGFSVNDMISQHLTVGHHTSAIVLFQPITIDELIKVEFSRSMVIKKRTRKFLKAF